MGLLYDLQHSFSIDKSELRAARPTIRHNVAAVLITTAGVCLAHARREHETMGRVGHLLVDERGLFESGSQCPDSPSAQAAL